MFNLKLRELPTEDAIIDSQKQIEEKFNYPMGFINTEILRDSIAYKDYSVEENYIFLKQFMNALFSTYYTEQEIDILSIYFLTFLYNNIEINLPEISTLIAPLLTIHSNKADIEFCLNSLRYYKLTSLLYINSPDRTLIQELISMLDGIEDEYNALGRIISQMY